MTAPEPTVDLTHLDFPTPCGTRDCDHVAKFGITTVCCGYLAIACRDCRDYAMDAVNDSIRPRCSLCKNLIGTWGAFTREVEL